MKKIISIILALILLFTQGMYVLAADNATATTMKIEKVVGTVKIQTQTGETITAREDMRIQSGYKILTAAASEVYITLDTTKVIKLGGLSACTIKNSGGKLDLMLLFGKLFFNVTAPLEDTETMNIRTSTMVTGIRGTAGTFNVTEEQTTLNLYEGTVEAQVFSSDTLHSLEGGEETIIVEPFENLNVTLSASGKAAPEVSTIDVLTHLTAFEAEAILGEAGLAEKIVASASASSADIGQLTQALEGDLEEVIGLKKADEQRAEIEIELKTESTLNSQTKDPVREEETVTAPPVVEQDDDDDDDDSSTPTTPTPTPTPQDTVLAAGATLGDVQTALANTPTNTVQLNGDFTLNIGETLSIPAGKTLKVNSGTLTVSGDINTKQSAALNISGTVQITENAQLESQAYGVVSILSENSLIIDGSAGISYDPQPGGSPDFSNADFINNGILNVGDATNKGKLVITANGELVTNTLGASAPADSTIINIVNGTVENSGQMNGGALYIEANGEMKNSGTVHAIYVENKGEYENSGTTDLDVLGAAFVNSGTFENGDNPARLYVKTGASFTNDSSGEITNEYLISVDGGTFTNDGTFTNKTEQNIQYASAFEVRSYFYSDNGTINNSGTVNIEFGSVFRVHKNNHSGLDSLVKMEYTKDTVNYLVCAQTPASLLFSSIPYTNATLKLISDIKIEDEYTGGFAYTLDDAAGTFTIDLAGFTFDLNDNTISTGATNKGTLVIDNTHGDGKLTSKASTTLRAAAGTLQLVNGSVDNTNTNNASKTVDVSVGGTFDMDGGNVYGSLAGGYAVHLNKDTTTNAVGAFSFDGGNVYAKGGVGNDLKLVGNVNSNLTGSVGTVSGKDSTNPDYDRMLDSYTAP